MGLIMNRPSLRVGQSLYISCNYGKTVREVTVSKVGRKYFELLNLPRLRFNLSDWSQDCNNYTASVRVYNDKSEYDQITDKRMIENRLSQFNYRKLSYEKLLRIELIIKEVDDDVERD